MCKPNKHEANFFLVFCCASLSYLMYLFSFSDQIVCGHESVLLAV
uniref:Uncharacterized protein n=1 Tax=Anguilla anguilla TaxID=7936 RepID=A0A0E9SLV7_ANGAN